VLTNYTNAPQRFRIIGGAYCGGKLTPPTRPPDFARHYPDFRDNDNPCETPGSPAQFAILHPLEGK